MCVYMYVCRDGEGEAGREEKERRGLATVCTIGLESLSFPIAPLNLFFFPFSSLLRASSHSSRVLSLSFLLSCVLSTSTLHHFPRSFLSCNLCLGGARCSIYVYVLADNSLSFLSCFLYERPSLHPLLLMVFSQTPVAFHEVRFRRCVSFSHSFFLFPSARLPRWLVYHTPFPRLIKRPRLKFSYVTSPIFIPLVFVNVCVCLYSISSKT